MASSGFCCFITSGADGVDAELKRRALRPVEDLGFSGRPHFCPLVHWLGAEAPLKLTR